MGRSRRCPFAALDVAGTVVLLAPNAAPAHADVIVEEAVYAGQVAALVHLYADTMRELAALSEEGAER